MQVSPTEDLRFEGVEIFDFSLRENNETLY